LTALRRELRSHPWLFSLGAGTAALAINQFGLSIFGGTEIIFGGWLPLIAAYAFGPWCGGLAAMVAFSLTVVTWAHPWGWICFSLEPMVVGWAVHRLRIGRVRAGLYYWLALGLPLAAIGIFAFTTIPFPSDWAIVIKYPLNSLLMTMIALPIYQSAAVQRWLGSPREREANETLDRVLFRRFSAIIGLAIAALAILVGRNFDQTLRHLTEEALARDAAEAARDLATDLARHQDALSLVVSQSRPDSTPAELTERLAAVRQQYRGFLTLLAARHDGIIIAGAPALTATGDPISASGISVADREYFHRPMSDGQPFLSAVFRGRGFGADLIVALSQPVLDADGKPALLVEGSLNLRTLVQIDPVPGYLAGRSVLILDHTRQVVASRGEFDRPTLANLRDDALVLAGDSAQGNVYLFDQRSQSHANERFIVAKARVAACGWDVYLAEPIWSTQRLIAGYYAATLLTAAIAIAVALLLARGTARAVTAPLDGLVASVEALSRGAPQPLGDVRYASRELAQMGAAVQHATLVLSRANSELAVALDQQGKTHQQLRQVLLHLDDKVRQRTAQLEAARENAESANRAKSEFIASTSHELRTPLNVILGMSEVLLERSLGELNARQHESIAAIDESGRHLLSLINDLLDLSKIEAGKFTLSLQDTDIRSTCQASLRFVRTAADRKRHQLELHCAPAPDTLAADQRRLKQILVNLLSNAVKFTPDGGQIRLEVLPSSDGAEIIFRVIDNGIGITREQQALLFRPFHQVDGALTRRHGGTGLGLALARRMAELHGGTLTVDSEPGRGSCFTLTLPWRAAPAASPMAPILPSTAAYKAPAGTRVLIAEDNDVNALIYERSPVLAGCRVQFVRNGRAAVDAALAAPPDLIIMDVQMPVLDGLTATRQLRADPRTARVPIIVVTALAMPEDRTRCLEAGATSYLSKPIDLRELARHVAEALAPVNPIS
jgi:signal transduction histidine kinase/ActR/RegA family two-component response regulator